MKKIERRRPTRPAGNRSSTRNGGSHARRMHIVAAAHPRRHYPRSLLFDCHLLVLSLQHHRLLWSRHRHHRHFRRCADPQLGMCPGRREKL